MQSEWFFLILRLAFTLGIGLLLFIVTFSSLITITSLPDLNWGVFPNRYSKAVGHSHSSQPCVCVWNLHPGWRKGMNPFRRDYLPVWCKNYMSDEVEWYYFHTLCFTSELIIYGDLIQEWVGIPHLEVIHYFVYLLMYIHILFIFTEISSSTI